MTTADREEIGFERANEMIGRLDAGLAKCQETLGLVDDTYIRCGKLAYAIVKHNGRNEGPYFMCREHADHNVKNRDARYLYALKKLVDVLGYKVDERYMDQVYRLLSTLEKQS